MVVTGGRAVFALHHKWALIVIVALSYSGVLEKLERGQNQCIVICLLAAFREHEDKRQHINEEATVLKEEKKKTGAGR